MSIEKTLDKINTLDQFVNDVINSFSIDFYTKKENWIHEFNGDFDKITEQAFKAGKSVINTADRIECMFKPQN